MSLPSFPANDPNLTRENALNQILASIAMEELGLSHIINAEGEKIQFALGTLEGSPGLSEPATIDDLLALNKSVRDTLEATMQNQMFLKNKMTDALNASPCESVPKPYLSSYMEALGDAQVVDRESPIVFDPDSIDEEGNNIVISDDGKHFTINRTGLYLVEWNVNLSDGDYSIPAVMGIVENGAPASGSSCSTGGSLSSGTLINVDTTPFTLALYNYADVVTLDSHIQYADSAASIRIVRFADGPSV